MNMRRAHITISGIVQGVFFRSTSRHQAMRLGLGGWAKNRRDGKVEIVVEKTYEQWFKELGFKEWKPQTEYEKLTGRSHEGHFWDKGSNYLLKV